MTEHAALPVSGYKPQTDDNVALANEGKELEERYLRWLDKLSASSSKKDVNMVHDARCIAEARTCIQTGAMWAIRAIFKPSRIKLPDDV